MMNVIEVNHKTFLGNIELKISEVLVTKGDLVLVGELGNLKDRLSRIRKRARQISRDCSGVPPPSRMNMCQFKRLVVKEIRS